jgi:lipopolysaccharide transport protein LptA
MEQRKIILWASIGFVILTLSTTLYFLVKRSIRVDTASLDTERGAIVFNDIKYSSEKKGIVDWELEARVGKKYIDRPVIELEDLRGKYKPKKDIVILFKGTKGTMDTERQTGRVIDVETIYEGGYTLKSKYIDFDFKIGQIYTSAPVDIKGSKISLQGVGMIADTKEETIILQKDINGYAETAKGRYKFESDRFIYYLKDNRYMLEGRVVMKGKDINLVCERLYLFAKEDELERVEAIGNVRVLSRGTVAKSEKAVYHFKEDKVVFSESPSVSKDNMEMEGDSIIYTTPDKRFSVDKPRLRLER